MSACSFPYSDLSSLPKARLGQPRPEPGSLKLLCTSSHVGDPECAQHVKMESAGNVTGGLPRSSDRRGGGRLRPVSTTAGEQRQGGGEATWVRLTKHFWGRRDATKPPKVFKTACTSVFCKTDKCVDSSWSDRGESQPIKSFFWVFNIIIQYYFNYYYFNIIIILGWFWKTGKKTNLACLRKFSWR